VTTEKFLFELGFESLRDLPAIEALKDAGLLSADDPTRPADREAGGEDAGDGLLGSEITRSRVA